jgi:hypothetical protein
MPGLFAGTPYELNLGTMFLIWHCADLYVANFTGFETTGTGYIKTPKLQ